MLAVEYDYEENGEEDRVEVRQIEDTYVVLGLASSGV